NKLFKQQLNEILIRGKVNEGFSHLLYENRKHKICC
ncbi:MAG: hypothetical protein QG670_672, partial [Thermoproteota archaeon]|nr:hypothetical protein [Thermoproteota archaeon]